MPCVCGRSRAFSVDVGGSGEDDDDDDDDDAAVFEVAAINADGSTVYEGASFVRHPGNGDAGNLLMLGKWAHTKSPSAVRTRDGG